MWTLHAAYQRAALFVGIVSWCRCALNHVTSTPTSAYFTTATSRPTENNSLFEHHLPSDHAEDEHFTWSNTLGFQQTNPTLNAGTGVAKT